MLHHSKPHVFVAKTHEAIWPRTKSKHRPLENLSANLPTNLNPFSGTTKKLVLLLESMCKDSVHPTLITIQIPQSQTFQNNMS